MLCLHTSKRIPRYLPPFEHFLLRSPHSRIRAASRISKLHEALVNAKLYLAIYFKIDIMVLVKRELLPIEVGVGCGQKNKIIEKKTDQFLLRFCLLQSSGVEKLPRPHRVCQRVEGDLLLERLLLRGQVQVDLEPLEPLRVLLHPHPLVDLVTEDLRSVQSLLGVDKVRVILWSVPQQLLHQERVLGHPLDGLEEVE